MSLAALLEPELLGPAAVVLVVVLALYLTFSGFAMVGVGVGETFVLLFLAPFVAGINLPVWSMEGTVIGVNLAGLVIPLILSLRFLGDGRAPWLRAAVGIAIVTFVAHELAVYEPSRGILVPPLPIALTSTAVGVGLGGAAYKRWGPLTFASGAAGTLIGADLLNLQAIVTHPKAPEAAVIGGAGTLDAIYLCAVLAVAGSILAAAVTRLFDGSRSTASA
jgi:uncharacterized membrane protein